VEAAARLAFVPGTGARLRLGAILVRDGTITPEQLEEALKAKEATGHRLGEILAERGLATPGELARALAEQHDLPYIDLAATHVEPSAVQLLPERLAARYSAVPIRFASRDTLLVAVADPSNVMIADELRMALGLNVSIAVSAAPDIQRVLSRYLSHDPTAAGEDVLEVSVRADRTSDGDATDAPAIKLVNAIIGRAIADGASDVHFEPQSSGTVVRARIDGVMRRVRTIPREMNAAITSRLKIIGDLDIAERRAPQDGRVSMDFEGNSVDVRIAILPTTYGEQVVLRILNRGGRSVGLGQLGMAPDVAAIFENAIRQPYGAVIACGPTGSGKTTTLYSALDLLNEDQAVLMTIEDPVEYQVEGINQIEVNPKAGLTFAGGLRTILRSDPDILLVGEVRDEETARIAIQAALTGHLVLTTLHSQNAAGAIARLKDMAISPALLATAVNCIVAQRLARRLCVGCREPYESNVDELRATGLPVEYVTEKTFTLHRPLGCPECGGNGYRGRVAIYEVMPVGASIRALIEHSTEEIFQAAIQDGMRTLGQDGVRLCLDGICSVEEIRRVTGTRT
jgi:type IV pilus assembly protein PilB